MNCRRHYTRHSTLLNPMPLDPSFADYLRDHLAGARFALALLDDLIGQQINEHRDLLIGLREEINSDRADLAEYVKSLGEEESLVKKVTAQLTQKSARAKLRLSTEFGRFEAVELLTLGVLGKLALWSVLKSLSAHNEAFRQVQLDMLIPRARSQYDRLERLRLSLAEGAFRPTTTPDDKG